MANKIDKMIDELLKDKTIGVTDVTSAKTVLTWILRGKAEAEKVSGETVKNLIKNGFANEKGNKLVMDDTEGTETVWFCLAVAGGQNLLKQVSA